MPSDVLVLGAGPAGIAIALLMARKGYSVEIVDPASFPRKKICGEFLNPQAVSWLHKEQLNESLLNLNPFPVYGMKIHDSRQNSFTGHYASNRARNGFAVMREAFDTLLVKLARDSGIVIHERFRAQKILMDGNNAIGISGIDSSGQPFEKKGTVLIGADGRNNLIGRTFGWIRGIRSLRKYAFQTYYDGLPELSNYGEVHLVQGGYIGIAPLNERLANVALVIDEKEYPGGEADSSAFLQNRIRESQLCARFAGLHPCNTILSAGPLAFEMQHTSGHRTLLVGDTCGFIDPFTGEGINYAFAGADLAADVLDSVFRSGQFDDASLRKYDLARKKMFSRKQTMNRLLQYAIPHPGLSRMLIRRFARNLDLADTMVSAVGSSVPVEAVWNLRFLLKLVFA